ncbi:putative reverse transcriptase domain-containing protein [Tanacetum coccineum]
MWSSDAKLMASITSSVVALELREKWTLLLIDTKRLGRENGESTPVILKQYELVLRNRGKAGLKIQRSVKNFQVTMEENGRQTILLLGRVGKSMYVLDYRHCLTGYYRRFIKGFSKIAKPITKLNQKKVTFEWSDKQEAAFQTLKDKLCSAPILALPQGAENFIAYCNVSHKGLGVVLMQNEKVIAYAS